MPATVVAPGGARRAAVRVPTGAHRKGSMPTQEAEQTMAQTPTCPGVFQAVIPATEKPDPKLHTV